MPIVAREVFPSVPRFAAGPTKCSPDSSPFAGASLAARRFCCCFYFFTCRIISSALLILFFVKLINYSLLLTSCARSCAATILIVVLGNLELHHSTLTLVTLAKTTHSRVSYLNLPHTDMKEMMGYNLYLFARLVERTQIPASGHRRYHTKRRKEGREIRGKKRARP